MNRKVVSKIRTLSMKNPTMNPQEALGQVYVTSNPEWVCVWEAGADRKVFNIHRESTIDVDQQLERCFRIHHCQPIHDLTSYNR
jgi:hypothetical protein